MASTFVFDLKKVCNLDYDQCELLTGNCSFYNPTDAAVENILIHDISGKSRKTCVHQNKVAYTI